MQNKTTGYVFDPIFLKHDWPGHPEHKGRLESVYDHLQKEDLLSQMQLIPVRAATEEELLQVHTRHYLDQIKVWQDWLDGDTYMNKYSYQAAIHAAGGIIDLLQQVQDGKIKNGIAFLRPPITANYRRRSENSWVKFRQICQQRKTVHKAPLAHQ